MSAVAILKTEILSQGLEAALKAAGPKAPVAIARALNKTGGPTETAYLRKVRAVLGLKNHRYAKGSVTAVMKRQTNRKRANSGNLKYSLAGWGTGFPLIYYDPKETAAGATVNWLGARKLVPRSFYLGGRFPRRRKSAISHSVWQRTGAGRWSLGRPKGPGLPEGMAARPSVAVWEGQAGARLPRHLAHELAVVLAGIA